MIHDAIVVRRIGTASLIELRGPPCAGERSTGDIADPPGDSLCIYQQLGAGSRFSGNPEFCIHHGMFATSYSDLPYETAPLAADGFHLRILKVPAADLRPSQADLVKAGLGDLVPKRFCEHGALVPLLASCFRDLKQTDDANEPERARSLVQALAQLALIERGLIRPGSRVALHALRVGRLSLARRLIARNISRTALSPALVADMLGISVRHLHVLFETIDISFAQAVTAERLAESRRLLIQHRQQSISEIALACGFNSIATFYRTFQAAHGMSPGEFRAGGARIATATLDLAEVKCINSWPAAARDNASLPPDLMIPVCSGAFCAETLSFFEPSRTGSIDFSQFGPMFPFNAALDRNAIPWFAARLRKSEPSAS